MTTATIAGAEVQINDEGFLTDPTEWTEDIARQLAANIGIELNRGTSVGELGREERTARKLLAVEAATLDSDAFQQLRQFGMGTQWIGEHKEPTAWNGIATVVLVAHVKHTSRVMSLDKQQLVKVKQWVRESDPSRQPARLQIDSPAGVGR